MGFVHGIEGFEKGVATSTGELRNTNIVCFDGARDFIFGFEDV